MQNDSCPKENYKWSMQKRILKKIARTGHFLSFPFSKAFDSAIC